MTRNRSWSYSSNKTLQGSEIANPERGSRSSQGSSVFTAYEPPEEDGPLGWHRVNNSALSYNSAEILGRGCDGTVVYMYFIKQFRFIRYFLGVNLMTERLLSNELCLPIWIEILDNRLNVKLCTLDRVILIQMLLDISVRFVFILAKKIFLISFRKLIVIFIILR